LRINPLEIFGPLLTVAQLLAFHIARNIAESVNLGRWGDRVILRAFAGAPMNGKSAVVALVISTLICVHVAEAQTKKIPRIGWLSIRHGPTINPSFTQGLRELGWFVGNNLGIEARFANERYDELPKLARELVQLNVDVIVVADSSVIPAAKEATNKIPIVMAVVADPVSQGFVASLARPGGNITGLSIGARPSNGKRLEILKEAVPSVSRIAILAPWSRDRVRKGFETMRRVFGVQTQRFEFGNADELDHTFQAVLRMRPNGLMVIAGPETNLHRKQIIKFASQNRLPAIYSAAMYVMDGGLMSYGQNLSVKDRRAAYYVDRILKGTKPSELPVEQPMHAEFIINLKTAKEIGLKIPPEVLQRADKVIK
jgi:putative tryptophan/tyrosine transport system substrate-binding protein